MSQHEIVVEGGSSVRLKTAGKYCDRDIIVTAEGGAENLDTELTEQDTLLQELKTTLAGKVAGGGVSDGVLPNGYTAVQAIKFTGEQAVETGIICNQNTKIRVVFTRDQSGVMYLYGVVDSAQAASVTAYLSDSGGYWRFGNQRLSYSCAINADLVQTAIITKSGITRANISNNFNTVSNFTAEQTLLLGAGKLDNGATDVAQFVGKVLAFDIFDGSDLVLSFIPCRNAEGIYGFWDVISEQFRASITATPLAGCYLSRG